MNKLKKLLSMRPKTLTYVFSHHYFFINEKNTFAEKGLMSF